MDQQRGHILIKHRSVKLITPKGPPNEKRPPVPQDPPDQWDVEILPADHVGKRQTVAEADVRNHEEIDVALVAGEVDDGSLAGGFLDSLEVVDRHVDAEGVEEAEDFAQDEGGHADGGHPEVRRLGNREKGGGKNEDWNEGKKEQEWMD